MARKAFDHERKLRPIKVEFAGGKSGEAVAEGNNAAWECACGERLLGRCYYQFGDTCYRKCEKCGRVYRVEGDDKTKISRGFSAGGLVRFSKGERVRLQKRHPVRILVLTWVRRHLIRCDIV